MKTILKKVYYCDFCKKKGLSEWHLLKHEKNCLSNPENKVACSGCVFHKSDEIYVEYSDENGEMSIKNKSTTYFCEKLNQKMHPLKAELKKLPEKYPAQFKDSVKFPKECEHYKFIY